ncbi:CBS domain-containing protein [archaeon]|nr:CBS domain-containing protein [archaeon]MBL7057372.1 CBS domain-containing protein [Candidatus Woesearchaeota archaeon]
MIFNSSKKIEQKLKDSIEEVLHKPVSEIMSKYIISLQKKEELLHAAQIIVGEKVSCVVIKEEDNPIAVLTERDFLKKAPLNSEKLESLTVQDLMSPKLVSIPPETTVDEAIPLLVKNNFRKLVVAKNDVMLGIVTQTDFVRLFNKFYEILEVKTNDLLQIGAVMTKNVVTIEKGAKFSEAKKKMAEKEIGSIIVLDNNQITGIITEYDVVAEIYDDPEKCNESIVDSIMTNPVMTVDETITIFEANRLMIEDNVRRLPVSAENELKGIITQTDMCRSIFYFLKAALWHINNHDLKWEKLEKRVVEKRLI